MTRILIHKQINNTAKAEKLPVLKQIQYPFTQLYLHHLHTLSHSGNSGSTLQKDQQDFVNFKMLCSMFTDASDSTSTQGEINAHLPLAR